MMMFSLLPMKMTGEQDYLYGRNTELTETIAQYRSKRSCRQTDPNSSYHPITKTGFLCRIQGPVFSCNEFLAYDFFSFREVTPTMTIFTRNKKGRILKTN